MVVSDKEADMSKRDWTIDAAHSEVHFAVRHMVVSKVRGAFERWTAALQLDEEDLTRSSVEVTIEAASIQTRNEQRDGHLRSPDFLDVERHPTITFRSKRVEADGGSSYRVVGDLTIRGLTREVVLETDFGGVARDPWGADRAGFQARLAIERSDFGLTWNQVLEAGGVLVGDRIDISIEVEAVAQAAVAAVG